MKKIAIFLFLVLLIITMVSIKYSYYKFDLNKVKKENLEYEYVLNKEIYGNEVASIMNRAINNNLKHGIAKDDKGKFIDNQRETISIEVKMLDKEETYSMEKMDNGGMENFVIYYNDIKFKCTKIEYHKATKLVKYMLFEQITQ